MSSRRIREIEEEIKDLERKLLTCHEMDKEIIRRKINNLKDELRRLKRIEEEEEEDEEEDDILASAIGLGIGYSIFGGDSSSDSGGFNGFGGGDSGGGGFGGDW